MNVNSAYVVAVDFLWVMLVAAYMGAALAGSDSAALRIGRGCGRGGLELVGTIVGVGSGWIRWRCNVIWASRPEASSIGI